MFVEQLLPTARERLVTIADDRPLIQATKLNTLDSPRLVVIPQV